jgi:large subunit ribosomal protein L21
MIAVIKTGGKQYVVAEGDTLKVEKLEGAEGDKINFEEVLLVAEPDGSKATIGAPFIDGVKIPATIVAHGRAKKVLVSKFKAKSRYYKRYGHRQPFTEVQIGAIGKASAK